MAPEIQQKVCSEAGQAAASEAVIHSELIPTNIVLLGIQRYAVWISAQSLQLLGGP